MTYYTIKDFVIGETGDPEFPAYVGFTQHAMKTTHNDFGLALAMMTNQQRRFGRQMQLREKGDLSNNPTVRNSYGSNGGDDNV